jgi:hypothetical protein
MKKLLALLLLSPIAYSYDKLQIHLNSPIDRKVDKKDLMGCAINL